jgi:hypothetical protein
LDVADELALREASVVHSARVPKDLGPWGGSASVRSGTGAEAAAGAAIIGESGACGDGTSGCCRLTEVGYTT